MRIATWNVNSIRARLPNVLRWLEKAKPDVLLMQEIKCETDAFPSMEFTAAGYRTHAFGQKAYNGVAIASLHPLENITQGLPSFASDAQARYLEADIQGVRVASIYLPNGNPIGSEKFDYKLEWMEQFRAHASDLFALERAIILGGDFNVICSERDVYDPQGWQNDALYHQKTRAAFGRILNMGYAEAFRSLHPDEQAYTFWDYQGGAWQNNKGLRIDHFLLSPEAMDRTTDCLIDPSPRGEEKASDHVPVVLDISS